jgi:SAM-dependent methyltransferase
MDALSASRGWRHNFDAAESRRAHAGCGRDLALGRDNVVVQEFAREEFSMVDSGGITTPDERWLAATWPFIREQLPPSPARVLEIGCGPLGGFVPAMRSGGYHAVGIDPEAPDGSAYHRTEFEQHEVKRPEDAIVACTSLHHVADLRDVVDRIASAVASDGVLVVVEWARERFDETTARWCFARLAAADGERDWLRRHRDEWRASGQSWDSYCAAWARNERLHTAQDIVRALEARFDTRLLTEGPYFFPNLDGITAADEQLAIDTKQLRPNGIRYVGQPKTMTG